MSRLVRFERGQRKLSVNVNQSVTLKQGIQLWSLNCVCLKADTHHLSMDTHRIFRRWVFYELSVTAQSSLHRGTPMEMETSEVTLRMHPCDKTGITLFCQPVQIPRVE